MQQQRCQEEHRCFCLNNLQQAIHLKLCMLAIAMLHSNVTRECLCGLAAMTEQLQEVQ